MKYLLDLFNIKENEALSVLILILQSVFLGTFYGAFDIGASALFLEAYPADMLPKAFLISGLAGILLTTLYSRFHNRINFANLTLINLATISILTILLRYGFEITSARWLSFSVFVMMGPLNIIGLLGFWGTVSRMYSLRQGKRLFGLIDTGQVLGIIFSSFAIPLLVTFGFQTKNTLLISSLSIILAFILQFVIIKIYKNQVATYETKNENKKDQKGTYSALFKDRYIFLMVLFVALSMITAFFVYNSFLSVSKAKYPESSEMAKFLGFFIGTLMIFSLLIKTFVYSNLMKTYGLRLALILTPAILIIVTLIASIMGSFGYDVTDRSFMLFFLLIVLGRLFSVSLKTSIEGPAFKLLYQSLDSSIRFDIQAKIDGVVNEFSALSAGIILTGLGALSFFEIIHFSYTLVIILLVWLFVAFQLYKYYRLSLEKSLESSNISNPGNESDQFDIRQIINSKLPGSNELQTNAAMQMLWEIDPVFCEKRNLEILSSDSVENKLIALDYIRKHNYINDKCLQSFSENEISSEVKEQIEKEVFEIQKVNSEYAVKSLEELSKSKKVQDKIYVCNYIKQFGIEEHSKILIDLLRDIDPAVRFHAINAASKVYKEDIVILVIENMSHPKLLNICASTLVSIGEVTLGSLEQSFYKTEITPHLQVQIVRIMGLIGGELAIHYLLNKLNFENKDVMNQCILSLRMSQFKADDHSIIKIIQVIENKLGKIAWDISAHASHTSSPVSETLEAAMQEEMKNNIESLMLLLSLAYDPQSVAHVKEKLDMETAESIGFAIELIDLFIHEELKPKLIPILEDISEYDKVKQLENHFPVGIMEKEVLIKNLLNRNPNQINRYTKICVLESIKENTELEIGNEVLAHIFNPDKMVREAAALTIRSKDMDAFQEIEPRLSKSNKFELENFISKYQKSKFYYSFEKIQFLKGLDYFKELTGYHLSRISDFLEYIKIQPEESYSADQQLLFIIEGSLESSSHSLKGPVFFDPGVSEMEILKALSEVHLYTLSKQDYQYLIINYSEIAHCFLNLRIMKNVMSLS